MVNPFILQAADAVTALVHPGHIVIYAPGDSLACRLPATRIILGIHTLLLGTGGRGCCGPGIRTITATGCRERDTHRRAYGADAGRGGTPRRNRRCCRPCRFAHLYRCSPRRSRRKRRYGKNAIQNFFHNNFPSLNEWRFTQKHFGRDRVYTTKACELRCGELAMGF